ncbi:MULTISPECIES: helix-turn-helix domain-containing protein [Bacteroides]
MNWSTVWQANGNRKVTAELLGTGRTTLYSKLEE